MLRRLRRCCTVSPLVIQRMDYQSNNDDDRVAQMLSRFERTKKRTLIAGFALALLIVPAIWVLSIFVGPHDPGTNWPAHQATRLAFAVAGAFLLLLAALRASITFGDAQATESRSYKRTLRSVRTAALNCRRNATSHCEVILGRPRESLHALPRTGGGFGGSMFGRRVRIEALSTTG